MQALDASGGDGVKAGKAVTSSIGGASLAALQLGKHNINVNSICPGITRTALSDANLAVAAHQQGVSLEEMERRVIGLRELAKHAVEGYRFDAARHDFVPIAPSVSESTPSASSSDAGLA